MAKQLSKFEQRVARQVGETVRALRERREVSRDTMAEWLGQTADAVAKAERGERRFSIADVVRLGLEFDCPVADLIGPMTKR